MANRIKGITIEIGGNTTGLEKALSEVDKKTKNTAANLKDVERLLKFDPTNTELLAQKQKYLGEQMQNTKERTETVKTALDQMNKAIAEGEEVDQGQYDALSRELIECERQSKNAEKAFKDFNPTLEKVGAKMDEVSQKAKNFADKTKALSAAGAAVAGGLITAAVEAGKSADDINTLAKQTGFATDTLQKFAYASDLIDVSMESMTGAIRKFKKNLDSDSADVQEAFARIGFPVSLWEQSGASIEDMFFNVIALIGQIPDELERDQIAMTIFGKSADDLAGIIDDGGQALRQYGEEAEDLGLILEQDALDGANAFNDGIDQLKARAKAAFLESGAALAESLLPTLEKLVGKLTEILRWVVSLDGDTILRILKISAITAAISPMAKALSGITALFGGIHTKAGAVGLVLGAVALAILAIVAAWDEMDTWQKVVSIFGAVAIAAGGLAIALGAVHSAWSLGIAIGAIVAGVAAIALSVGSALKDAKVEGADELSSSHISSSGISHGGGGMSFASAMASPASQAYGIGGSGITDIAGMVQNGVFGALSQAGMGNGVVVDNNISFNGSLSGIAEAMEPQITTVQERKGVSLIKHSYVAGKGVVDY